MNYKHAFHAGNHADVLKHIVLLALLDALKKKDAPLFVMDTHAGRGRYLLAAPESRKTGEADAGILRLMGEAKMPEVLERYLRAVEANNPVGALVAYPGSPLLAAQALRAPDRLAACELQPEEAAALPARSALLVELQVRPDDSPLRLNGSGLAILNPPWQFDQQIAPALPLLKKSLGESGAMTRLEWIRQEA